MNKFEQVSSDGHQMSLAEESQVSWPGLGVPGFMSGGGQSQGAACTMGSNTSWVMVTWDPHLGRQTHNCENITFQQLRSFSKLTLELFNLAYVTCTYLSWLTGWSIFWPLYICMSPGSPSLTLIPDSDAGLHTIIFLQRTFPCT